jgi:hypothetical protein
MEHIGNKTQALALTDRLLETHGRNDIVQNLDNVIFDRMIALCESGECCSKNDGHIILVLKDLRDMYFNLDVDE